MAAGEEARNRLFYTLPTQEKNVDRTEKNEKQLLKYIRENIIGNGKKFSGPYGIREALYLDYTASGKSLRFIEDYIRDNVLPEYGNTHTTTSVTSLQTTLYRHEARDIVRNAVHASEHDAVIFVGSGTTGAIHKLIHSLNLDHQPIVFVGPFEHHSNLLPWKEVAAKVIKVQLDGSGQVDLEHLQHLLLKWKVCGRQMIGCFTAASNITGVLVDVDAINVMLHRHGALAFWDYATAGPYVKVDMNPVSAGPGQPYMYKDAVFMSCHKFVGGVQTPGVLIAKKSLFRNKVPGDCGGGSIFFVRRESHRYLQEPELKEEGGTPAIVEAIRAGLVFQLKQALSPEVIMEREHYLYSQAKTAWQNNPSLVMLGNMDLPSLPIFSFLVYHPLSGMFLHHNYVSVLLNDLFGIQARGGCACAGPYAMDLLGMDEETSCKIEHILAEDSRLDRTHLRRYREYSQREIIRPGFTRINLPYFLDEASLQFTLEAVSMVAEHGWKLLPQYMFNPETGEWRQKNFQVFKDRKWLGHISYQSGEMSYKVPPFVVKGPLPDSYQDCLQKARDIFDQATKTKYQLADHTVMFDEESKPFRWFLLPSEAADCLHGNASHNAFQLPFCPPALRERIGLSKFVYSCDDGDEEVENYVRSKDLSEVRHCYACAQDGSQPDIDVNDSIEKTPTELFSQGFQKNSDRGFWSDDISADDAVNGFIHSNKGSNSTEENCLLKNSEKYVTSQRYESSCSALIQYCKPGTHSVNKTAQCDAKCLTTPTCVTSCPCVKPGNQCCGMSQDSTKQSSSQSSTLHSGSHGSTAVKVEMGQAQEISIAECEMKNNRNKRADDDDMKLVEVCDKKRTGAQEELKGSKCSKKDTKNKWVAPPKEIFKPFVQAVEEFNMLQSGDRVLVCLSGGKDSLSLLHTVHQYQFYAKKKNINFHIGAVTVDPETPAYNPRPLKAYLATLGVPYFYEAQSILAQASSLPYECASICSFCSRMKRGRIYACARREGYNVLAFGQHLDDLCESFMMSFFHNGILRTMKAQYTVEKGDLRVIRPFVYVREKDLRTFAGKNHLPVIAENCPACFEAPKERHRVKQLLAGQEILFPRVYPSMLAAMKPILAINRCQVNISQLLQHQLAGNGQGDEEEKEM